MGASYLTELSDCQRAPSAERPADVDALRTALGAPLTAEGDGNLTAFQALVAGAEGGIVATAGPRYFGFVNGGSLPVGVAADWLVSAWDQNTGGYTPAPALSVAEEVAGRWVREILGLPPECGIGFVTGCQMAHFTCLAAARHAVLRDSGWDVEAHGLHGGPPVRVIASDQAHVTVGVACRMLGLGQDRVQSVATDEQGRMRAAALESTLAQEEVPTIVCAQAGDINTGAFDPISEIVASCRSHGAW